MTTELFINEWLTPMNADWTTIGPSEYFNGHKTAKFVKFLDDTDDYIIKINGKYFVASAKPVELGVSFY